MTTTQRLRLADRYAESLASGHLEDLVSILAVAETDPELSRLLIAISRGDAEENGTALEATKRDEIVSKLAAQVAATSRVASSDDGNAHDRTYENTDVEERPDSRPFMRLVVDETGRRPSEIADALGTTPEFIDDVNDYPDVAGEDVVLRLVIDTEATFGRPAKYRGLYAMRHNHPREAMAASRDSAYNPEAPTFAEIIERSGMESAEAARWLSIHTGDQS